MNRCVVLVILDGWGVRDETAGNAIALARTPHWDGWWHRVPTMTIESSGEAVGLPPGQMGNSEVGHTIMGAGRIVYQDLMRITKAIDSGEFFSNPVLCAAVDGARERGGTLHLLGLVSDGGVHSHITHLEALVRLAAERGLTDLAIHAFLDGRDTSPTSGRGYVEALERYLSTVGVGRIATVMGRYYPMDRDHRWERVARAYAAIVHGEGTAARDAWEAVVDSYTRDVTDEFVLPAVLVDAAGRPRARVRSGDEVLFFNFRADRARQLAEAFTEEEFGGFDRGARPMVHVTCMADYHVGDLPVAFAPVRLTRILPALLAEREARVLRIAETEKYAHVTFFFSGGDEGTFPGEERILVPSPSVPTYDLKPEMSAYEVTARVVPAITSGRFTLVVLNYANADMVGHTGDLEAAMRAVEAVDSCLGRVVTAVRRVGGGCLITADHGNAEQMMAEDGGPHTAHTTNPVPLVYIDAAYRDGLAASGGLQDIAPTILGILGLPVPPEMTGRDLRRPA